jgi:hypothetical protein
MSKKNHKKKVKRSELENAYGFLLNKVMDMELKTEDGHEICPMFGFCDGCKECFIDRFLGKDMMKDGYELY